MKVLHIAPTPFFSNRGCHIRIRNEIEGLQQNDTRVLLCTYHHGNDTPGIDIRRIRSIPGYKKTDVGYSPYKFIADILLFFLVLKTAWIARPVILHGHLHEGALIGWGVSLLLFWRRIPLIMDMQGSLSGELKAYGAFNFFHPLLKLFLGIEKIICRLPAAIVCSSENSLRFLREQFGIAGSHVSLLEDVVPDRFLVQEDKEKRKKLYGVPEGKRVVIYTGSLLPGKGIDYLLDAKRILLSRRTDLFFVFAGYPKNAVVEYALRHGLTDHCLIPGEFSYDELRGWLAVADLAIDPKMADHGEASGKILHYMASGLPVACFDLPNNRNFLGQAAYYAEPGSVEGLAAAIEKGLADPVTSIQYGKVGRQKIKKEYSVFAAGVQLRELYEKLQK